MAAGTDWRAGTARTQITPDENIWMAGYAARDKPAAGVEQELFASAVALEDGCGSHAVLVGADLIGFPPRLRRQVERRTKAELGLDPDSLLLVASHTHCGPQVREPASRSLSDEEVVKIDAYTESLVDDLVATVEQALADRSDARLGYTKARCGFAMNRRTPRQDGVANHPHPWGPVDHEVPVLRIDDPGVNEEESLRAVVFGYACHNTTLSFNRYCGDWAGYAKQYLRGSHPSVTTVFLTGCAGDQNPYPRRELEYAKDHGRAMANAVETALSTDERMIEGSLTIARANVTVPYDTVPKREELERRLDSERKPIRDHARRLLERLSAEGKLPRSNELPVGVVQIGPELTQVVLPGEPVVDYATRLKASLPGTVWPVGYAMESVGYVPSARVRYEGGYEAQRWVYYSSHPAPYDPSVEDRLVGAVHDLVEHSG